eukprot:15810-Heterococcus_DN1.PRE.2
MYSATLERLDNGRGSPSWDFGTYFCAKEALALLYRQLGLPAEALTKYQELAALIITLSETVKSETVVKGVTPSVITAAAASVATAGSSKHAGEQSTTVTTLCTAYPSTNGFDPLAKCGYKTATRCLIWHAGRYTM